MSAWQPIETAPKDGTVIMLYDDRFARSDASYFMASWRSGLNIWSARANSKGQFAFWDAATHWMPLPAPPVSA